MSFPNILEQIPEHLKIDICYYLWRRKVNQLHQQINRIFVDLQQDGRLWIKEPFLYRPDEYSPQGAMLAFNFRQTNNPEHKINISCITRSNDLYQRNNHDYIVFRNHLDWDKFIHHKLPNRYLYSSGSNNLHGYQDKNN